MILKSVAAVAFAPGIRFEINLIFKIIKLEIKKSQRTQKAAKSTRKRGQRATMIKWSPINRASQLPFKITRYLVK